MKLSPKRAPVAAACIPFARMRAAMLAVLLILHAAPFVPMASAQNAPAQTAPAPASPAPISPAQQPAAPAPDLPPSSEPSVPLPEDGDDIVADSLLPRDLSPWGMFMGADIVVKAVIVGLVFASFVTWTIMVAKGWELAAARARARAAFDILIASRTLDEAQAKMRQGAKKTHAVDALVAAATEESANGEFTADGVKERAAIAMNRIEARASAAMNRGTGLLATIGATAPFVGLFGTVWGIMNSFIGISKAHTTNLAVVAPGIAEALLATALGLFAAIPAVVIYNAFARSIGRYRALLADASAETMRLLSRDLERKAAGSARTRAARTAAE